MKLFRCTQCGVVRALEDYEKTGRDGRTCGLPMASRDGAETHIIDCGGRLQELSTPVGDVKNVGQEIRRS